MSLKRIKLSEKTERENLNVAIEGIFDGITNYFKTHKRNKARVGFNEKAFSRIGVMSNMLNSTDGLKDSFNQLRTAVREDFLSNGVTLDKKANSRFTIGGSLNWICNLDTGAIVRPNDAKSKMRELFGTANTAYNQALPSIKKRQKIIADLDALKTDEAVEEYLSKLPESARPKRGIHMTTKVRGVRDVMGSYGVWFSTEWEGGASYIDRGFEAKRGLVMKPLTETQAIAFAKEYLDYLDYIEDIVVKLEPMISDTSVKMVEEMWEDDDSKVISKHGVDKWLTFVNGEENVQELDEVLFDMRVLMLYSVMGYYRYLVNAVTANSKK